MRSRARIHISSCKRLHNIPRSFRPSLPSLPFAAAGGSETYSFVYSIGEESYSSGIRPPLTDTPTFCVDPIGTSTFPLGGPKSHHGTTDYLPPDRNRNAHRTDGTTNFVHGFPYACISLGLIDQRVPVLGVIYNPFLEHLYTGVRGAGSFLRTRCSPNATTDDNINDATLQRLPLSPASGRPLSSLAGALVAVEWGSDRAREPIQRKADSFSRLAGAPPHGVMTHSLRSVGSAALNFALVAQGALDMYWCVLTRDCRRRFRSFHFWGRSTSHLYFVFFFSCTL